MLKYNIAHFGGKVGVGIGSPTKLGASTLLHFYLELLGLEVNVVVLVFFKNMQCGPIVDTANFSKNEFNHWIGLWIEEYSISSSKWVNIFPEALNLNQSYLKLNWFICN